jgi:hypothetical protein
MRAQATIPKKKKRHPYQFLLSSSVLLLGLSETGLVGGLVRLGGLNPLRSSRSHCDELDVKRETEKEREELPSEDPEGII